MLRGRCRACKLPISIRYPIVELLTALLFVAVGMRHGWSLATVGGLCMVGGLVAITFIDMAIWEIPDEISLPGVLIGVVLRPLAYDVPWYDGLVGAALGASFLWFIRWLFFVLRNVEGMGLGDVKLIAMIGAFLGPFALAPMIMVASVSGTLIGGIVLLLAPSEEEDAEDAEADGEPPSEPPDSKADAGNDEDEDEDDWVPPPTAVPFGPFLSLGAIATLLFEHEILGVITAATTWLWT